MSSGSSFSGHDIESAAQADRASRGMVSVGSYTLRQTNRGERTIALPNVVAENCDAEAGDEIEVKANLMKGYVVLDLTPVKE